MPKTHPRPSTKPSVLLWVVTYHHQHGTDAWPLLRVSKPDLKKEQKKLRDFEPDRGEYLALSGPFRVTALGRRFSVRKEVRHG